MAVSFLSKPVAATPLVAPIDQNLVFQSLLRKQAGYDQGVQLVDQQLKNLSSQTILNAGHKAYYTQKVADLTNQINNLGGADFGERGTLQQIAGLSGQISQDERIIGAIADTRRIQGAVQQMETWKADPKKYGNAWAVQNQYALDKAVSAYANDATDTAKFSGTAESFYDHGKLLNDRLDKIRSQIQKSGGYEDINGNYIVRTKDLTPLEIRAIVDAEVQGDPRTKRQLQLDADYQYQGVSPESFRSFRTQQVLDAKQLLVKNVETYRQTSLLDLKTGTPAEQAAKLKQYNQRLEEAANLGKQYDQQLARIPSTSHAEAVMASHLETYRLGYENKYAFSERKLTVNPMYGINLAHQDRQAALQQNQQQFNSRQSWEKQKFSYEATNDWSMLKAEQDFEREMTGLKLEADVNKATGLKKGKDGNYYALPAGDVTSVTVSPDLTKPGLGQLYETQNVLSTRQNKLVEDLVIEHISNGDVDTANRLHRQLNFTRDANGNVTDMRYAKKDVSPNMAIAAGQLINEYRKQLNGQQADPTIINQMSTQSRQHWNAVRSGVVDLALNQKKLDRVQTLAIKESGLTPAELREREQLATDQTNNWPGAAAAPLSSVHFGTNYAANTVEAKRSRLQQLNRRYDDAVEKVAVAMGGVTGQENGALLIQGDSAKPDSVFSRTVQNRIMELAALPEGRTNAELQALNAQLGSGKVIQQRLLVDKEQVEITVQPINADNKPEGAPIKARIPFSGTREWKTLVPEIYQNTVNGHYLNLKKELDETGGIYAAGEPHVFSTTKGTPLGFTAIKHSDGEYGLGYMYKGKQLKIPMYLKNGKPFVPQGYKDKPIEWIENYLDQWVQQVIVLTLQLEYGMKPDGKPDPNYVFTPEQFNALLQNKNTFNGAITHAAGRPYGGSRP